MVEQSRSRNNFLRSKERLDSPSQLPRKSKRFLIWRVCLITLTAVMVIFMGSVSVIASASSLELYYTPYDISFGVGHGIVARDLSDPAISQQVVPHELVNTSTGIAIDHFGRKLYWISDTQDTGIDKIRRSNLDGSSAELFLLPSGQPAHLAIDPSTRKLYFSERFTNNINVIDLDGTNQQTLVSTHEPRGMTLDLVNRHMYWVEFETNRLRRADLDGSGVTDVIVSGMTRPFDVAVDPIGERLYWVEFGPDTQTDSDGNVWTADIDGSNPVKIADGQRQPSDVVIDYARSSIYWGDENGNTLRGADLDGSDLREILVSDSTVFRNLALDHAPIVPEPSGMTLAISMLLLNTVVLSRMANA